MRKNKLNILLSLVIVLALMFGCSIDENIYKQNKEQSSSNTSQSQNNNKSDKNNSSTNTPTHTLSNIPQFSGKPFVVINNNKPYFTEKDLTTKSYESYGKLDNLGRCTVAMASISKDLMPTEKRKSITQVKPTGWQASKYDCVDGKYLYNRCHLIGYQLTAENANNKNLITGTRYLNVEGMLPFENMVADYVKETNNHVLYRVTPIFDGDNLVASGVLMEGYSVEDKGEGIEFCVYAYNVQPNVNINYATGESTSNCTALDNTKKTKTSKTK